MALLCLDLDNTLINRTGAFRLWASGFVDRLGLDPHEVGWMMEMDLDGFARRSAVFEAIRVHFNLDETAADVMADYRARVPELVTMPPHTLDALHAAKARGWRPWLVSNGEAGTQVPKLTAVGLDRVLDGWVVSDEAGVAKPSEAIFDVCAQRSGERLEGAWMIGDNGHIDIGGAHNAGMCSVWIHRNRSWEEPRYAPTFQAASVTDALELIGAPSP